MSTHIVLNFAFSGRIISKTDALCTIEKKTDEGTFENYFIKASHLISKDSEFDMRFSDRKLVRVKVTVDQSGKREVNILGEGV